jgi:hypothetical protein
MAGITKTESQPVVNIGDLVKILHISDLHRRVVEFGGALGPGGAPVYRVEVRKKPKPSYVEVRADQLEVISTNG